MSGDNFFDDEIDDEEEDDEETPEQSFAEMEAQVAGSVPTGAYITIRHEAGQPYFVPLNEGEQAITISEALNRRMLTVGTVSAYVEGAVVPLETQIPAGTVVTLVGAVKGG